MSQLSSVLVKFCVFSCVCVCSRWLTDRQHLEHLWSADVGRRDDPEKTESPLIGKEKEAESFLVVFVVFPLGPL